ncbi:MAG: 30S ribosome-binding factor RbfA [Formosimonas sp.]|jgi:ribosome-binding factor A
MAKKAPTDRTTRISEQIKKDVSVLITREMRDPRIGMVTIQEVQLTPDYAHAKLFFTVLGADSAVCEKVLNESSGFLRNHLFKMLRIHTVPSLHFVFDSSLEKAIELSSLIDQANATPPVED